MTAYSIQTGHRLHYGYGRYVHTLKILPTDKTGIDVIVGEGDGAELLEVKVKDGSVDCVQVRAAPT